MANATMVHQIDATLVTLASAMRIQFAQEPNVIRAVDRAVEILAANLPYEFDGVELRVLSFSRTKDGIWHVATDSTCTCESGHRAWCRHRALFRLVMSQWCMTHPASLRAKIVEQCVPAADFDEDDLVTGSAFAYLPDYGTSFR